VLDDETEITAYCHRLRDVNAEPWLVGVRRSGAREEGPASSTGRMSELPPTPRRTVLSYTPDPRKTISRES
jgi:hypothetical protein